MTIEDRLDFQGNPRLDLGLDTGDEPIVTTPSSEPSAARASTTYVESRPGPISSQAPNQPLGRVEVSDIISPNRFRRVYQSVRIRRSDQYRGPIKVEFATSVGAIISEELGSIGGGPRPARMPAHTQTVTTHGGGDIRGYSNPRSTPPPARSTQTTPARDLPFNSDAADRYGAVESIGNQVGSSVDFENIQDTRNGTGTDSALETLGEIVRPRSWARHTVLEIRFRMPIMEPMLPASVWDSDAIPFGDTIPEMEANAARQSTIEEFTLMAGSSHIIEIPYPVGSSMPVHFDIINNNPIYSANVNMSATVYVTR